MCIRDRLCTSHTTLAPTGAQFTHYDMLLVPCILSNVFAPSEPFLDTLFGLTFLKDELRLCVLP